MRLNPPTNDTARGYGVGVGVRRVRACVRRDAGVRGAPISAWDRAVGGCGPGRWSITYFSRYILLGGSYVLYIHIHTYICLVAELHTYVRRAKCTIIDWRKV